MVGIGGAEEVIHETLSLIKREFRPQSAFNNVARISSFHRIQCSPGIREAAQYVVSRLLRDGLETEIMSYPASQGISWWGQDSFPEWEASEAELWLLEDGKRKRLCSFAESKLSIIQRSMPTPPEGISTTMVLVEDGANPTAYEGLCVKGKFVMSRGDVAQIAAIAIDQFGAEGVVVDTMRDQPPVRDRFDLADARQYLSFWPANFGKHRGLGFVLTPRQGAAIRAQYAAGKNELAIYAKITSRYYDGTTDVASAFIPGETDEEVVGLGHICHPEPSANDNASGCGALMEAARTLSRLISSGLLPKPRRSIRFLWLPEMSGSYAYLANHEDSLHKVVAAINLDMVGENQNLCGSTFNVEKPVRALPGFGGDLAEAIMYLMVKETTNLGGTRAYPMFRWAISPFSGGSDHNIWGDPSVGITCPMLIQWPDKFYHTSADTIDKVDPDMLALAGVLTATYLYTAATATPSDAAYVAGEMATRFAGEVDTGLSLLIQDVADRLAAGSEDAPATLARARRLIERRIAFHAERKHMDIDSLLRLAEDSSMFAEARQTAHKVVSEAESWLLVKALRDLAFVARLADTTALPATLRPEEADSVIRARSIVPTRVYRGPVRTARKEAPAGLERKALAFSKKYGERNVASRYLEYWADGTRTLAEIADLIEGETGFRNMDMLVEYFELMLERGVFRV